MRSERRRHRTRGSSCPLAPRRRGRSASLGAQRDRSPPVHRRSRSRCWRRSPIRPSSPSRMRGSSPSWSSGTRELTPRRWSSRPPPARYSASSPRRRPTSSACFRRSSRRPPASCDAHEAIIYRVEERPSAVVARPTGQSDRRCLGNRRTAAAESGGRWLAARPSTARPSTCRTCSRSGTRDPRCHGRSSTHVGWPVPIAPRRAAARATAPSSASFALSAANPRPFTERQIALVGDVRRPGRHRHRERPARSRSCNDRVGELQALGEVGQAVSSILDLQEVLTTIVAHAVELSGTDGGVIYEYDEATERSTSAPPTCSTTS